jgi:hypothetical protein
MRLVVGLLLLATVAAGCRARQEQPPTGQQSAPKPESKERMPTQAPPAAKPLTLTAERASALVRLSLSCVDKEYPNKLAVVLSGPKDVRPPSELHPAFFGCFDWHSAVHGHWAMARILRSFPALPEAPAIREALAAHLTEERLSGELATFSAQPLLERPYGWAWLLRLSAELRGLPGEDAQAWVKLLGPLEQLLAKRTRHYLKRLSVPVRAGTHNSTAFALAHILDYARAANNQELADDLEAAARRFYLQDRACPSAYEPSGEDFISPCLAEADLMRRVLQPAQLRAWLDKFLPGLNLASSPLFTPPRVLDPKDPKLGHLIGLDFHRAWCLRGLALALGDKDDRSAVLQTAARAHTDHGLKLMTDSGYGGAHWLASFAIYLLTDVGVP